MSLLDEVRFQNAVVTAAQAIALGDRNTYQSELQVAQDQLLQARNHFYPVDCFFLELILVVPSVAGAALRNELQRQQPVTLLLNGETLRHIATTEPETMALIRERLAKWNLSLIGGANAIPNILFKRPSKSSPICAPVGRLGRNYYNVRPVVSLADVLV